MPRKTTTPAKAPAQKAAAKAPAKKSVPKKAAPKNASPTVTTELEIRIGGRIVFLQPVDQSSYDLKFTNGNLTIKANTADATPEGAQEVDFSQPVDEQVIAVSGVDPDEEVEVNPDVNLQVHTGQRDEDEGK